METEPTPPPARSRAKRIRRIVARVWVLLGLAFVAYLFYSYRATGFDRRILSSGPDVAVASSDAENTVTFTPAPSRGGGGTDAAALVFIPGSMVDPDAYAPLAHAVASRGHRVTIMRLPFCNTFTDAHRDAVVARVKRVIESGPPGTKWVVAGHSLGGVLAARFARDHPTNLDGLVLIGTSHPRDFDLSHLTIDVTKITATHDGLASPAEVRANAKLLPPGTRWVTIDGGNHAQFGYYGRQLGDGDAVISREAQQAQTLQALLDALGRVDGRNNTKN